MSRMERGWYATGLLEPLWGAVGGRDGLAKATGIQPATISGYNTGRLRMGLGNARKIATALGVSLLELGAPVDLADPRGRTLLDRLEALEAALNRLGPELGKLGRRVRALEQRDQPRTQPKGRKS